MLAQIRRVMPSGIRGNLPRGSDWASSIPGADVVALDPMRQTCREPLHHLDAPMARRFATMSHGRIKARSLLHLKRAMHWGGGYGCVWADGIVARDFSPDIPDFVRSGAIQPSSHSVLNRLALPRPESIQGHTLALNTFGHGNFHHWLLDTLPAFSILEKAGKGLGDFDHLLLLSPSQPYQLAALQALGIPDSKVIRTHSGRLLALEQVTVPSYSEPGRQPEVFDYTPEGLEFVRKLFNPGDVEPPFHAERLVVSRKKARARRWVEGDQAPDELRRAGFREVLLEDYTVQEQASLFFRAKIIIMPTGGNLANMVFCQPGTRIIELFHPEYLPTFSLTLASALGLDYVALVQSSDQAKLQSKDTGSSRDISIPMNAVMKWTET